MFFACQNQLKLKRAIQKYKTRDAIIKLKIEKSYIYVIDKRILSMYL